MKVLNGLREAGNNIGPSAVTIGVFDGVHRGHRRVISRTVSAAKIHKLKSVVVTFDPHPLKVIHSAHIAPSLISLKHRIRLIEGLGADILLVLKFTKKMADLTSEDFVKKILVDKLNAKEVYVSDNFYFGRSASSGVNEMRRLGNIFGFEVNVVKPVKIGARVVSSSLIRDLIKAGELKKAEHLLGRPASVLGTVVRGDSVARELGFPTANINPHHEVIPPSGVYAVKVSYGGRIFSGVLNIGTRPTFYAPRDLEPTIEVHIFSFNKTIYGKDLEVLFAKKIRDEKRFKNSRILMDNIRKDARRARAFLKRNLTACAMIAGLTTVFLCGYSYAEEPGMRVITADDYAMFSEENKAKAVSICISRWQRSGVIIRKDQVFYKRILEDFCKLHPELSAESIGRVLKTLIIMEYDWDEQGAEKDKIARYWLGDEVYEKNRMRLLEKLKE